MNEMENYELVLYNYCYCKYINYKCNIHVQVYSNTLLTSNVKTPSILPEICI